MHNIGVASIGIKLPIIKQGDNLGQLVTDYVLNSASLDDNDVIGITESVVARAQGNYVTVDDIAKETERIFGKNAVIQLCFPIYSRNRFSMILKGIARACKGIIMMCPAQDEVGNPWGMNPMTGVDIKAYYRDIVESQNCLYTYVTNSKAIKEWDTNKKYLICSLHNPERIAYVFGKTQRDAVTIATLQDYFKDKCQYGLLGSNKANEETLKLFPSTDFSDGIVQAVQSEILKKTGKKVEVMIYGDGCFKDPNSGIWEFADPVPAVAYTNGLLGSPNEIKLKAFADDKYGNYQSGKELDDAIKNEIANKDKCLFGSMASQGTTPRSYLALLASLMDLTSGSGDKGTPVVLVKNYFKNYADA